MKEKDDDGVQLKCFWCQEGTAAYGKKNEIQGNILNVFSRILELEVLKYAIVNKTLYSYISMYKINRL